MSDLIERQKAIDAAHYYIESGYKCDIFHELKDIPSVEPERTAKVECIAEVYKDEIVDHYLSGMCGICGESTYDRAKYCSWCGARLDWSDDE